MTQDAGRTPWWHGKGDPLTSEQAQRLRADVRFRLWVGVPTALGSVIVFLGAVLVNHQQHPDKPVRWPLAIALSVGILVVLAAAFGVGLWVRNRNASLRAYVVSGDRKARLRVATRLRQGQAVDEEDLAVARAAVAISRRQWWLPLYLVVLAAFYAVVLLADLHPSRPRPMLLQTFYVVMPGLMVVLAAWTFVLRRRLPANAARQGITPGSADAGSRRP